MIIAMSLLNACSFSNTNKEVVSSRPSDELEFAVDTFTEPSAPTNIAVEEQKITSSLTDEMQGSMPEPEGQALAMTEPEEPKLKDFTSHDVRVAQVVEVTPEIIPAKTYEPAPAIGFQEKYQVQKGDTLMLVAFKIYGDYRKWKELKAWNGDILKSKMGPGVELKYNVPDQVFGWKPSGMPYMVKTGDNLGMISME